MDTKCQICNFSLLEFKAKLELGGAHHSIYCPVCGAVIVERAEFAGVFYDDKEHSYIIWDLKLQRAAGPATAFQGIKDFELTVTGRPLNPNDLCYKKVIIFQHEHEIVLPHSVLKPEYRHYLKPYAQASGRWDAPHVVFDLPLKGDLTVPIQRRALVSQTEAGTQAGRFSNGTALNIWPNFKREGWNNYFIYFASSDPNVKLQTLNVIGEGGETLVLTGRTARGEIHFMPELVEIKVADSTGAEYWSCYQVEFKDNESVPAPVGGDKESLVPIIALDFGTSNTCFAIKFSENSQSEVVHFRDRTKRMIRGLLIEDSISVPWFPEINDAQEPPSQIPSELSFYKETEKIAAEIRDFQPIVHYTIPPFTRYREGEEKFVQGEFKWEHALPETLRSFTSDLQYLYLILAFRMALAEIVSDPRCQRVDQVDFVATCPLAFSESQRDGLRKVMARVQETIDQQTGVKLVFHKFYDESHAGESGSGQMPGTDETIYVDVGGGTTDIGYFRFDKDSDPPEDQAIYLDSIQYAGDDVWKALTEASLSAWGSTRFEREARAKGAAAIFNDPIFHPFQRQRNNAVKAKRALRKFIEGLVEYTVRMMAARERFRAADEPLDTNLGLYLLGNGWRFIEALEDRNVTADVGKAIAAKVKTMVEDRLRTLGISAPPLTVIYPIVIDRDPKTVVALGAIQLYVGEKAASIAPEPEFALKSFLGSDLIVFSPRRAIKWYESVPYPLPRGTAVKNLNYERPAEFNFELEQIDGIRIQEINLLDRSLLMNQDGTTYVNKNMMSFYLENWHKRLLIGA